MIEGVTLFSTAILLLNSLFDDNDVQANTTHFLCISEDQSSLRMQEIPFQSLQIFKISPGKHASGPPKYSWPSPLTAYVPPILSWLLRPCDNHDNNNMFGERE